MRHILIFAVGRKVGGILFSKATIQYCSAFKSRLNNVAIFCLELNMDHSACFIGHRKIKDTPELRERVRRVVVDLIKNGTVNFLFGDNSEFNTLCYEIATELKKEYPEIRRIKFRKDFEDADEYTMRFLVSGYEDSICPEGVGKAGKASYVKRNEAMIRESEACIFYYDENYKPARRKPVKNSMNGCQPKSGTALAYEYAIARTKVINVF